jgi:hypothetical protein
MCHRFYNSSNGGVARETYQHTASTPNLNEK